MKIRSAIIFSMLVIGACCTYGDEGENHHSKMMIDHIFGDKTEITRDEFVKHFTDKFDKIDEENNNEVKTGKITKDQAMKYFDAKMKEHMQKKFCNK